MVVMGFLSIFTSFSIRYTRRWPSRRRLGNGSGTRSDATSLQPCFQFHCRSTRSPCTAGPPDKYQPPGRGPRRSWDMYTWPAVPSTGLVAFRPCPACALARPPGATVGAIGPATRVHSRTVTDCRPSTGHL